MRCRSRLPTCFRELAEYVRDIYVPSPGQLAQNTLWLQDDEPWEPVGAVLYLGDLRGPVGIFRPLTKYPHEELAHTVLFHGFGPVPPEFRELYTPDDHHRFRLSTNASDKQLGTITYELFLERMWILSRKSAFSNGVGGIRIPTTERVCAHCGEVHRSVVSPCGDLDDLQHDGLERCTHCFGAVCPKGQVQFHNLMKGTGPVPGVTPTYFSPVSIGRYPTCRPCPNPFGLFRTLIDPTVLSGPLSVSTELPGTTRRITAQYELPATLRALRDHRDIQVLDVPAQRRAELVAIDMLMRHGIALSAVTGTPPFAGAMYPGRDDGPAPRPYQHQPRRFAGLREGFLLPPPSPRTSSSEDSFRGMHSPRWDALADAGSAGARALRSTRAVFDGGSL